MKTVLAPLALMGLCVGCSALSNHLFSGAMPAPTAPRVLLPAARLMEIAGRSNWLQHYGEAPYWDPTLEHLHRCEVALWRRVHWSGLHDELGTHLLQYFGVTQYGRPRVAMIGVCSELLETYVDSAAKVPIGSLHGGQCEFEAVCDPATDLIASFSLRSNGWR
jgi:hypothetical protein